MSRQAMRLTETQRELVESNMGLAGMIAKKYWVKATQYGMDYDDVFSVACLGLMRAARTYDPKLSRPSTYLTYGCETAVQAELRKNISKSRSAYQTVSIENVLTANALESMEPSPEEAILSNIAVAQIYKTVINKVSERDRQVLLMRIQGMTQYEIADAIGKTQGHVSRILNKIKQKLQMESAA